MKNRLTATAALVVFGMLQTAGAVVLLTEEAAIDAMLPDADEVLTQEVVLTTDQLAAIKGDLGGKWTLYQAGGAQDEAEEDAASVTLYHCMTAGECTRTAIIETQPGKWGPVQYIVALDHTGTVKDLAVMMYVEKRGRPIALRSFLGQFVGKSTVDPILVGKDIKSISGATISCRATAFAVKKAIAIHQAVAGPVASVD